MPAESSIRELQPKKVPRFAGDALNASPRAYRFGDFVLDMRSAELSRAGAHVELRPCTFHLLGYLVENAGRVISRGELFDRIWPDVSVSDGALTQSIWEVRRALGEAGREQHFIRTVRGSGYCFTAAVHAERAAVAILPRFAEPKAPDSCEVTETRHCLPPPPPEADADAAAPMRSLGAANNPVVALSRMLHTRVQSGAGAEQIATLVAAYDDLIAVAQRLGLTEVEIDARLARAACLLAGADHAEASAPPRARRQAYAALR